VRTRPVGFFALCALPLLLAVAFAQTPATVAEELALETAIVVAMRNNREVRNAILEVDKSEAWLAAGRAERWPQFRVGLEQAYLLASIDLTFASGVEQATNRLADLEPQIAREVNDSYRKLHEARILLDVTRVSVEAEREKQRVTLDRYRQQMALLRDTLQAQAAVADANQQHQAALLAFWTARADFERAMGEE
jgi:outer membrane protein TolC